MQISSFALTVRGTAGAPCEEGEAGVLGWEVVHPCFYHTLWRGSGIRSPRTAHGAVGVDCERRTAPRRRVYGDKHWDPRFLIEVEVLGPASLGRTLRRQQTRPASCLRSLGTTTERFRAREVEECPRRRPLVRPTRFSQERASGEIGAAGDMNFKPRVARRGLRQRDGEIRPPAGRSRRRGPWGG